MGGLSKVELFLKKHLTENEYDRWVRNTLAEFTNYAVAHGFEEAVMVLNRTWRSKLFESQSVIAQSFEWRKTPEGNDFWASIDHDIRRAWRVEMEAAEDE
jgi:hypothetical protein